MTIEYLLPSSIPADTISLEQAIQCRIRRRRRVAKRMAKRFTLFAVEFMQPRVGRICNPSAYPSYETFVVDVTRSGRTERRRGGVR